MKTINILIIYLFCLSSASLVHAVENMNCVFKVSEMLGGQFFHDHDGYGRNINFSFYQDSQKILLLSDDNKQLSIGEQLAEQFADKMIVSTDFSYSGKSTKGPLTKIHMDNTQRFPIDDNSFDTIVMRKGLCVCKGENSCAGFCALGAGANHFFSEVVRVLDKSKAGNIVILHGNVWNRPDIKQYWRDILFQLEEDNNISVFFHDTKEGLNSIQIITK